MKSMSALHVRQVPEELYEALRRSAQHRGTSISAETIRLLSRGLKFDRPSVEMLFDEIERSRPRIRQSLSAASLIREDRDRR